MFAILDLPWPAGTVHSCLLWVCRDLSEYWAIASCKLLGRIPASCNNISSLASMAAELNRAYIGRLPYLVDSWRMNSAHEAAYLI